MTHRVCYDPERLLRVNGETVFNLWRGFNRKQRCGLWSKMRRHLYDIICKRDRTVFRNLIYWLAHAVQRPGTAPGSVIVLKSDAEGSGKTTVGSWLVSIFGEHGLMLSTPKHLVGNFNDHLEKRASSA